MSKHNFNSTSVVRDNSKEDSTDQWVETTESCECGAKFVERLSVGGDWNGADETTYKLEGGNKDCDLGNRK